MLVHRYAQGQKIGKTNNFKNFGSNKTKGLNNKTAKIHKGHLCLRRENSSFNNNYISEELENPIINIGNRPCQCQKIDYGVDDTLWD